MNEDLQTRVQRYLQETERTPLTQAIRCNDADAVRFLLSCLSVEQRNIEVNRRETGYFRWTPLQLACLQPDLEILRILIEGGADVHASDATGQTPLTKAIEAANENAVSLLVQAGAGVTLDDVELASDFGLLAITAFLKNHLENISFATQK